MRSGAGSAATVEEIGAMDEVRRRKLLRRTRPRRPPPRPRARGPGSPPRGPWPPPSPTVSPGPSHRASRGPSAGPRNRHARSLARSLGGDSSGSAPSAEQDPYGTWGLPPTLEERLRKGDDDGIGPIVAGCDGMPEDCPRRCIDCGKDTGSSTICELKYCVASCVQYLHCFLRKCQPYCRDGCIGFTAPARECSACTAEMTCGTDPCSWPVKRTDLSSFCFTASVPAV